MKVGFLGAGSIARAMAMAVKGLEGVEGYAVASRDLSKAQAFCQRWGFQKAYGSYEEMLQDPEVNLVYVATPHSHHFEHPYVKHMTKKYFLQKQKSQTTNK